MQSGVDPPKKVALGERAVSVDGADYIALSTGIGASPSRWSIPQMVRRSSTVPVFRAAPNPNVARLHQNWMCSADGQQALVNLSAQYVPHILARAKPGRRPLFDIKAMRNDPAGVLEAAEAIKAKYGAIFKV
jgi:iron(III) transport system substrate-binding protein